MTGAAAEARADNRDIAAPTGQPTPETPAETDSTGTATPTPTGTPSAAAPTYVDVHGTSHPAGPAAVRSTERRDWFLGEDFDSACYDGADFDVAFDRFAEIAKMIRRSGRRVVMTIVPNKSAVYDSLLPRHLPHGACTRRGLRHQDHVLTRSSEPAYLPIRRVLTADDRRTFWPANSHWTSIGAVDWTLRLAHRLAPSVAEGLRYRPTTDRLAKEFGVPPGKGPVMARTRGLEPVGVRVRPAPGQVDISPSRLTTVDHSWHTRPRSATVRGRTLLVGDSFTYLGLRSLRPVFANGRFVWTGIISPDELVTAILRSNTVVIEQVQRLLARSALADPDFVAQLRAALAAEAAGR